MTLWITIKLWRCFLIELASEGKEYTFKFQSTSKASSLIALITRKSTALDVFPIRFLYVRITTNEKICVSIV